MLLRDGDTGTSAWQSESEVASMTYEHSHPMAPVSSSGPHEMSASCPIGPDPVIGAADPWYPTSNGRLNLDFADNAAPSHPSFPALWNGVQPHGAFDFSTHGTSQGDSYGASPSFFHLTHSSGHTDCSPVTSPLSSNFTSADSFSSSSPSLSSTLSIDLDTMGEEFEPPIPGAVKNVVGSQKIAAAAYKRRSRTVKYICPYHENGCEAEFTARHNLEYHINSHMGRKPYKCKKGCPYAAPSPATVRRHEKACPGR